MKKIILTSMMVILLGERINAGGTTVMNFLKLTPSAKISSFGGAHTALVGTTLNSNPANLSYLSEVETNLSYALLYEGIHLGSLSFGINPLSVNINYLTSGKLEGYDQYGNPTQDYTATNLSVSLSYSYKIAYHLTMGTTLKVLYEKIEKEEMKGFAADVGVIYLKSRNLSLGAMISNIGQKMGYYEKFNLPLMIKLGLAYRPRYNLLILSDIHIPTDYIPSLHAGIEYTYKDVLVFRLGARTKGLFELGPFAAITAGMGFKIGRIELDYALIPYGELGLTHFFTLSSYF
jgi:hypothetical protein